MRSRLVFTFDQARPSLTSNTLGLQISATLETLHYSLHYVPLRVRATRIHLGDSLLLPFRV